MYKNGIKLENCFPVTMKENTIEPEEGEIVDDYELISSDEEFSVRQRIRELEEENAEIEQIAVISRSYDIDRAARIPSDASSISSIEFKTPKKRKRHKNKEHKKKTYHHHSSGHHRHHGSSLHVDKKSSRSRKTRCKRREKLLKKKHTKTFPKDLRDNLILGSPESLNSSISSLSLTDSDGSCRYMSAEDARDDNYYYRRPEIRDTLRLAIARSRKNSTRQSGHNVDLKERLLRKDLKFTGNQFKDIEEDEDDVVICEPVNEIQYVPDDSVDSIEESELRLIALKSAVMKKHMDRKRRNAEAAYSPTDLDDLMSSCVVESDDKLVDLEVVNLDEDDSQNVSPIASPHFAILDCLDDSSQMVNCKPVDMDIADSDSEDAPAAPHIFSSATANTIPYPPYPPNDLGSTYPYDLYIPDFNTNSLNPPPPGVDDYEDIKQVKTNNYVKHHDMDAQDMDVENDDFVPIETFPTTCSISQSRESLITHELKMNGESSLSLNSNPIDEDTQAEEEEQALRALLLSKFNSPKNQKKPSNPLASTLEVEKENRLEDQPYSDSNRNAVKPTEAILKEAVKRLKVVGMCKENICHENTSMWEQPLIFDQQKDICLNMSPVLWHQPQHQQESVYEMPEPQIDSDAGHSLNQQPNLKTLVCLKKKVKELKKNKDVNYEGSHQNLSTVAYHLVKSEVPAVTNMNMDLEFKISPTEFQNMEIKPLTLNTNLKIENPELATCCEPSSNSIAILDEDTKRRLQKLKEDILLATQNNHIGSLAEVDKQSNLTINNAQETLTDHPFNAEIQPAFLAETIDENCTQKETTWQEDHRTSQEESVMKEGGDVTNISKTKPLNLNESKEAIDVSLNNTALKENNLNKQNKNMPKLKPDIVVSFKNAPESKKIVRTVCETTVSIKSQQKTTSSAKNLKTVAVTAATVIPIQDALVKPIPTYSMVRTTKIVKPNKVINKNVDLKRKVVLEKSKLSSANLPKKIAKGETAEIAAPLRITAKPIDNSRLITSMDQVRHICTVAQFVISLQQSSNESSDDELVDCDSMYKPLYEYNDIKSPLSLNLESPCLTPARVNSPVDVLRENATNLTKLKRSPITFPNDTSVGDNIQKPIVPVVKTPVAVRHLPAAAQDEYRKLVNRMKLLENQRLKKESLNAANESPSTIQENNANSASTPAVKPTLVKQVLLKNTNNKSSSASLLSAKMTTAAVCSESIAKPHKGNVLRAYESLYAKIGAGIMNNLDKSLSLVEEAKRAKINKLKVTARLKKLKDEMELLQTRYKVEEEIISRIYPNICSTNEVITSMKQKRSKVFKAALNLGKSLKGEDYRLNNELKQNITNKSKKLASEIKMVNSLKAENIDKLFLGEHVPNGMDIEHPVDITNCQESSINIENVPAKSCENETDNIEDINQVNLITNHSVSDPKDQSNVSTNDISDKVQDDEQNRNENITPRTMDKTRNSDESNEDRNFEDSMPKSDSPYVEATNSAHGVTQQFQKKPSASDHCADADASKCLENGTTCKKEDEDIEMDQEDNYEADDCDSKGLLSYTSPLDHLRNINGIVDPNGVVCPYDLMGNCEDSACKYVHISQNDTDLADKLAA